MRREKYLMLTLMGLVVLIWSFEYVVAKHVLETFRPLTLIFFKYLVGFFVVFLIKQKQDPGWKLRRSDIITLAVCSLTGEILYFQCEYSALDHLPISLITVILAFVPVLSLILERIVFGKKIKMKLMAGVLLCVVGIVLIIGVDARDLAGGRFVGYLLAFGAVFAWNAYNFITAALHRRYTSISLTFMQLSCTLLLLLPYMFFNMPDTRVFTPDIIGGIMYLGVMGASFGFLVVVRSLHVLGPTTTALFSNFMPVTATLLGWLFYDEFISPVQIAGGALVILSAAYVIREKGKMEELPYES